VESRSRRTPAQTMMMNGTGTGERGICKYNRVLYSFFSFRGQGRKRCSTVLCYSRVNRFECDGVCDVMSYLFLEKKMRTSMTSDEQGTLPRERGTSHTS